MEYVTTYIKSGTATKLMIINEIDSNLSLDRKDATIILENLIHSDISDFLRLFDYYALINDIDIATVPQFGSREMLIKAVDIISDMGACGINCAQLGFRLKQDPEATIGANTKFGENHGKAAMILGLAKYERNKFYISVLGEAFCRVDEEKKDSVLTYLFLKVPIIQLLLQSAKAGEINAYDYMIDMKESTRTRRGQCLRKILRKLSELENDELKGRINNIKWLTGESENG